jgi:large subunit ribosomal protein L24
VMKIKTKLKSKIKKGDTVVILSGKDKGKTGQVLTVYPCASKVLVSGVNVKKKSVKANPFLGTQGGFLELEAPLFLGKVMYFDAASNSAR